MSDYVKTRSETAIQVWQVLAKYPNGLTLPKLRAYYKLMFGVKMPVTDLFSIMQANDFLIWQDDGKYYPYRDDVSGKTFEHEFIDGVIRLVDYVR